MTKHRCPKCKHVWEAKSRNQAKGGKARWAGFSKEEKSEMMRRIRTGKAKEN